MSIDALRGAAALAVVLFHFQFGFLSSFEPASIPAAARWIWPLLSFGYTGVWLFFVISGFCIHLRWAEARAAGGVLHVGFVEFWRRRVRRLYPPYLVALAAYAAVRLSAPQGGGELFGWSLGLHLAMLQNIDVRTLTTFNSVFWTLAIEEQLYLAYFLLLWLRARYGWTATLLCCAFARVGWFALAFALNRAVGIEIPVTHAAASQWFVWALGALAVEASLGLVRLPAWTASPLVAAGVMASTAVVTAVDRLGAPIGLFHNLVWLFAEPAWGLGFFVLVNHAVLRERSWQQRTRIPTLVHYAAGIGLFSYSLYLTHQLVLSHLWPALVSSSAAFVTGVSVFVPLTVGFGWMFFRLFERPFLNRPAAMRWPALPPAGQEADPVGYRP